MDMTRAVAMLSYVLALGFLAMFGVVIIKMLQNKIDLSQLVAEPPPPAANGQPGVGPMKASLSRFQLLVFTFVVAGLFLVQSLENGQIMEIPNSVLGLLGISGGSYLVSKNLSK